MSRRTIYRIVAAPVIIAFFVTGIGNLVPFPHIAQDMAHLGYPAYFRTILGTWKIIAAITWLIPGISRAKDWAFAGMMLDLTGAAFSRYSVGDNIQTIIIPIATAALVTIAYILRLRAKIAD